MKKCAKCKIEKPLNEFNKHSKGSTSWCKICVRKRSKQYYEENREQIRKNQKRYEDKNREWFNEYKKTLECSKCGENHISCLDFHHINSNEKEFGIAQSISTLTKTKEQILKEISKCIVLCSNCHRKFHWEEKQKRTLSSVG